MSIRSWLTQWFSGTSNWTRLQAAILGEPTASGISIDERTALSISVVYACIRAISDPIGFLPLRVYQKTATGRRRAEDHPLYEILHDSPNKYMGACDLRSATQAHALTWGNGWQQISRSQSRVVGLYSVCPTEMSLEKNTAGEYVHRRCGEVVNYDDYFHLRGLGFDGMWGYSVITLARESLGLTSALERYGGMFFGRGGRMPYVLEHPGLFRTEEEYKKFKEEWKSSYGSAESWHDGVILTGGMKYSAIGIKPEDAQFLGTRQFQIPEICRWFRVSPHLVGDLSRATFSNIEHLGIEFLTQTLSYWLKLWEQEVRRKLFTPKERAAGYYAEFDTNALLRGDYKSRMEGYAVGIQNGIFRPDEPRAWENLETEPGVGDKRVIQLNMQPLATVGQQKQTEGGTNGRNEAA